MDRGKPPPPTASQSNRNYSWKLKTLAFSGPAIYLSIPFAVTCATDSPARAALAALYRRLDGTTTAAPEDIVNRLDIAAYPGPSTDDASSCSTLCRVRPNSPIPAFLRPVCRHFGAPVR
jgi:hypothetical protein